MTKVRTPTPPLVCVILWWLYHFVYLPKNPDTSTCVCDFMMALPFRLSTKKIGTLIFTERHDQGSNPDTSTCVCDFMMALPFRLSTKKIGTLIFTKSKFFGYCGYKSTICFYSNFLRITFSVCLEGLHFFQNHGRKSRWPKSSTLELHKITVGMLW
jgi:hypothetical protein